MDTPTAEPDDIDEVRDIVDGLAPEAIRVRLRTYGVAFVAVPAAFVAGAWWVGSHENGAIEGLLYLLFAAMLLPIPIWWPLGRETPRQRELRRRLCVLHGPEALDALYGEMHVQLGQHYRVTDALADRCREMTAADAPSISPRVRRFLYHIVASAAQNRLPHPDQRREHLLGFMHALSFVGDRAALDAVSILATRRLRHADEEPVRQAASECAARMRLRLEHKRDSDVLLRPAATPETTLLRPAMGVSESDDSTLLRPAAEPGKALPPANTAHVVREQAEVHGTT